MKIQSTCRTCGAVYVGYDVADVCTCGDVEFETKVLERTENKEKNENEQRSFQN